MLESQDSWPHRNWAERRVTSIVNTQVVSRKHRWKRENAVRGPAQRLASFDCSGARTTACSSMKWLVYDVRRKRRSCRIVVHNVIPVKDTTVCQHSNHGWHYTTSDNLCFAPYWARYFAGREVQWYLLKLQIWLLQSFALSDAPDARCGRARKIVWVELLVVQNLKQLVACSIAAVQKHPRHDRHQRPGQRRQCHPRCFPGP